MASLADLAMGLLFSGDYKTDPGIATVSQIVGSVSDWLFKFDSIVRFVCWLLKFKHCFIAGLKVRIFEGVSQRFNSLVVTAFILRCCIGFGFCFRLVDV